MWGINSTGSMMGFYLPTSPLMWFWCKWYQPYVFNCFCVVGEAGSATATSAGGVVKGIVAQVLASGLLLLP